MRMAKTLDRENEFMHLLMKSEGGQRIRGITLLRQLYVISMRWPGHVKTGKYYYVQGGEYRVCHGEGDLVS